MARNLAAVSAIIQQREDRERKAKEEVEDATEESMDLICLDDPDGDAKKAGDDKGDYKPVT